jgi:glycosyltransferase involved in cell wall biosynthesis
MSTTLTIGIPTYNRAPKLERLLRLLESEIVEGGLADRVKVFVSDNASTDDTPAVLARVAASTRLSLAYQTRPENVGFDRNVRCVYMSADTDYVWLFADDDIPLPGSVRRLLEALDQVSPDFLLCSFVQPPGSNVRQFRYANPVHVTTDPIEIVRSTLAILKVSVYTLRRLSFTAEHQAWIDESIDSGWFFVRLAYATLEVSPRPTLAIVSEPLATSDDEFDQLDWPPVAMLRLDRPLTNHFVVRHAPGEIERQRAAGYYAAIQFCFAAKVGALKPARPEEYDAFFRGLPFRASILLKNPKALVQYLLLTLGVAHLWPRRHAQLGGHSAA